MESVNKRPRTNEGVRSCSGSDVNRLHNQVEVSRTKRHLPPAHYSLRVKTYSLLSEIEKYESGVFEAGGFKWRLCFYPNGDEENNGENYISLYLEIVETDKFSGLWEVNVNFKLFVHNQLEDKYLSIQDVTDGDVKRFHEMKRRWGFPQLLALGTFKDPSNGYLVDDSCVFGAEILVIKHTGKWESLSMIKAPYIRNSTFTWEIENFSKIEEYSLYSKVFTVGQRKWRLEICPNGSKIDRVKWLSLYLMPYNWEGHSSKSALYAQYKLRVLDQISGKHYEKEANKLFCSSENLGYGYANLASLNDLREPSKGFIVKDSLTVEVEFVVVSETEYSS